MAKRIFLLRHCSTTDNERGINASRTDTPLSSLGTKAAEELVPVLNKYTFDLIYVSPLQRTFQTIEPYLNTLADRPPVIVDNFLNERDLGELTNTEKNDGLIKAHREASGQDRVEWVPPQGESIRIVYERAQEFFEELQNREEENILIVSHLVFLRCLELIINDQELNEENYFHKEPLPLETGELRIFDIK